MSSLNKTAVKKVDPKNPDRAVLKAAADLIKNGGLVAFPTETVYGLAVNRLDERALKRLYEVKGRPQNKPLTVHIAGTDMIIMLKCRITGQAKRLMERFWPGPLTIILESEDGAKIGFRMPNNRVALDLLKMASVPVVAPSANLSGSRPAKNAGEVLQDLDGKIDLVIDAGPSELGAESTVIDASVEPFSIIRKGALPEAELRMAVNES